MQLTRVALAIPSDTDDSFMIEQTMHGGMGNDKLRGIAHFETITIKFIHLSFAVLIDVLFGQNMHLFQASQLRTDSFVEMFDLRLNVLFDLFKTLQSSMIAEICNGAIAINLCFGLAHPVDPESPAVVELIEDPNPARYELQNLHFLDLIPLLFALGQRLIGGQLIYVLLNFFALLRQKVLEHVINAVIIEVDIVLFGIMKQANQPSHVIVTDLLVLDLLCEAGHAQWMLDFQLEVTFCSLVTVDLLVQLAGLDDCAVVAQVESVLLLEFVQAGDVDERHLMFVILLQANMIK